jgi:hypothetical protein
MAVVNHERIDVMIKPKWTFKRRQVSTSIDEGVLAALRVYSAENYEDMNRVIENALSTYLHLVNPESTWEDVYGNLPSFAHGSTLMRMIDEAGLMPKD